MGALTKRAVPTLFAAAFPVTARAAPVLDAGSSSTLLIAAVLAGILFYFLWRRFHPPFPMPGRGWGMVCLHWNRKGRLAASRGTLELLGLASLPPTVDALIEAARNFLDADSALLFQRRLEKPPDETGFMLSTTGGSSLYCRLVRGGDRAGQRTALCMTDISGLYEGELKKARDFAGLSHERDIYRALLDAAPLPIWWRDDTLRLAWVNRAFTDAVESSTAQEAVARQTELASNAVTRPLSEVAGEALGSGKERQSNHYVVIDGQRRAIRIFDRPVPGKGVAGFALDHTALEEARTELRRHIEAHSETLNKLSSAVAIFGPDKYLEFFNRNFADLWGLSEDWLAENPSHGDILETMLENRRLPEQADFPAWKRERLNLYTSLIESAEELWHLPDGRTLRVISEPHPLGGLLIIYEDVTDRLALERSFNTLTAVQQESLNSLHEGVAVFGSDGILKLHNPAYAKIWNLASSFLAKKPHINEVVRQCQNLFDDAGEWDNLLARILGAVADQGPSRGHMHRSDGSIIEYIGVPLPDGATLLTYIDVSDSRRIEQALRERNDALETADRLKSEFIAHVSYELRTPLNTIIGFTEILDHEYFGPLNTRQREYVQSTLFSTNQLLTLINDILDLATIEAGAMSLDVTEFDLYKALESIAGIGREQAQKKGVSVKLDCTAGIGVIEADERRLKQVIFNLLSNAIKFTPANGDVIIGARRRNGFFECFVTDNGIGIESDKQREVFSKFWTDGGHGMETGAGLGLSLVRSFTELHGGKVTLTSAPDRGTRVTCQLPVKAQEAGETPPDTRH